MILDDLANDLLSEAEDLARLGDLLAYNGKSNTGEHLSRNEAAHASVADLLSAVESLIDERDALIEEAAAASEEIVRLEGRIADLEEEVSR